jgi:hypothetical protein
MRSSHLTPTEPDVPLPTARDFAPQTQRIKLAKQEWNRSASRGSPCKLRERERAMRREP